MVPLAHLRNCNHSQWAGREELFEGERQRDPVVNNVRWRIDLATNQPRLVSVKAGVVEQSPNLRSRLRSCFSHGLATVHSSTANAFATGTESSSEDDNLIPAALQVLQGDSKQRV